MRRTPLRQLFFALVAGWLAVALAMATQGVAAQAASQVVESIIVRLHADTPADREALAAALGTAVAVSGSTRDGALQLTLQQPLTLTAARAAVNRARLLPQVVYANVAGASVAAAAREDVSVAAKVGTAALANHPPVTRLIVKYRDPAKTNAATNNEQLTAAAAGQLASFAG